MALWLFVAVENGVIAVVANIWFSDLSCVFWFSMVGWIFENLVVEFKVRENIRNNFT